MRIPGLSLAMMSASSLTTAKLRSAFLGLLLGSAVSPAEAVIRHVPTDYPNIQAGIDAAVGGDIVEVADGTYTGPGNHDISFHGKAITVRSENGFETCVIDCGGFGANQRGFLFNEGETSASVLDGFTITNGWKDMEDGGGICILEASPVIRDCWIRDNVADGLQGGGIYCRGSNAHLVFCVITNNSAGGYHDFPGGGGIWAESSDLSLRNCTISGNWSGGHGPGGLYLSNGSVSQTIVWGNCSGDCPDFDGDAVFTCCDVNLDGFCGGQFDGPQVYTDPYFCDAPPCPPPWVRPGDYHLRLGSACLPEVSPCGELIGALGQGCGGPTPIRESTWGRIKSRYQR